MNNSLTHRLKKIINEFRYPATLKRVKEEIVSGEVDNDRIENKNDVFEDVLIHLEQELYDLTNPVSREDADKWLNRYRERFNKATAVVHMTLSD